MSDAFGTPPGVTLAEPSDPGVRGQAASGGQSHAELRASMTTGLSTPDEPDYREIESQLHAEALPDQRATEAPAETPESQVTAEPEAPRKDDASDLLAAMREQNALLMQALKGQQQPQAQQPQQQQPYLQQMPDEWHEQQMSKLGLDGNNREHAFLYQLGIRGQDMERYYGERLAQLEAAWSGLQQQAGLHQAQTHVRSTAEAQAKALGAHLPPDTAAALEQNALSLIQAGYSREQAFDMAFAPVRSLLKPQPKPAAQAPRPPTTTLRAAAVQGQGAARQNGKPSHAEVRRGLFAPR